jgi:hypothetical protein
MNTALQAKALTKGKRALGSDKKALSLVRQETSEESGMHQCWRFVKAMLRIL